MADREIPISDQTVERLKSYAEPLVDTFDSVILRLADFYDSKGGKSGGAPARGVESPNRATASSGPTPNLRHTKVMSASINGETLSGPNWNSLVFRVVQLARKAGTTFQDLKAISLVNLVEGRKVDQGYHYLPAANVSVQGQDANGAWRTVAHLASRAKITVEVRFVWREKEGAERPGESYRLFAGPK